MSRTREVLRLSWPLGESVRRTALAVGVSRSVVSKMVARASAAGLDWEAVEQLDDEELDARLYGVAPKTEKPLEPDPRWVHQEYKRAGVTLELLHLEYLEEHPGGMGYTSFCNRYRDWLKRRGLSMRQVHRAGEKGFVDYSGKKPHYIDRATGSNIECVIHRGAGRLELHIC
jgi:transposase